MPKVGDKEFSYTDDGMRQAQIYANRTGQKIKYDENNRKFGYQEGGYTSDEYLYNALGSTGYFDGAGQRRALKDAYRDTQEENQRKRTFIEKHGSLPESVDQPPSLLDESIQWKLIKQLAGPPQWIKNYGEADQMMTEGYDRYGRSEDHWPAFVKGIKEAWGYQEGGEAGKVKNKWDDKDPGDLQRKLYGRLAKFQEGGYSGRERSPGTFRALYDDDFSWRNSPYEGEGVFAWDPMYEHIKRRKEINSLQEMYDAKMREEAGSWTPGPRSNWDVERSHTRHKSPGKFGF